MANEENLKRFDKRSKSEAREISKKGGIKSGERRRENKAVKDILTMLLSLDVKDNNTADKLKAAGVDCGRFDNKTLIAYNLFKAAADGDLKAIELCFKLIGETPEIQIRQDELKLKRAEYKLKERITDIQTGENSRNAAAEWLEKTLAGGFDE